MSLGRGRDGGPWRVGVGIHEEGSLNADRDADHLCRGASAV